MWESTVIYPASLLVVKISQYCGVRAVPIRRDTGTSKSIPHILSTHTHESFGDFSVTSIICDVHSSSSPSGSRSMEGVGFEGRLLGRKVVEFRHMLASNGRPAIVRT